MFSIGCDIEEIDRFEERETAFFDKIFTRAEVEYCRAQAHPAQHFAARFCAKEAVVKALAGLGVSGVHYRDIEVVKKNGVPAVELEGFTISISLSHAGNMAMAAAAISKS
ncbi:MAG: 4'-phosphopantetheinyl transferase superfamily protein [Rickettsiales bacterium]|jgi:phosphopantetheine--protein transferase-like protein|nr:4'-phosphopantetheinyl transferase superfamily protein [Rickettsiales bacterium]